MRNLFRKAPPYITVPGRARPGPAAESNGSDSLWVRCENERCRELLEERALVRDSIDASKVREIREQMERAEARRLVRSAT